MITRRSVLTGTAAVLAGGTNGLAAEGHQFPVVVDIAHSSAAIIARLTQLGVKAVFRYYAYRDDQWEGKLITKPEAEALYDAGLSIGAVYQYHNNELATFTKKRAKIDAEHSLKFGQDIIGQPSGSAVYFGVDGDWPQASALMRILEYFEVVNQVFINAKAGIRVGVYGSGRTCQALLDRGLAELFWLPKSTGWTGTPTFYNSGKWTMYQHAQGTKVGTIALDANLLREADVDLGTFDGSGAVRVAQPTSVLSERRFVRQPTLDVHESSSADSKKVGTLRRRQNCVAISSAGGWVEVAIGESGVSRGFVRESGLTNIDTMP